VSLLLAWAVLLLLPGLAPAAAQTAAPANTVPSISSASGCRSGVQCYLVQLGAPKTPGEWCVAALAGRGGSSSSACMHRVGRAPQPMCTRDGMLHMPDEHAMGTAHRMS
jgi:hypothetical protein